MSATDVHDQWIKDISGGRFDPAAYAADAKSGMPPAVEAVDAADDSSDASFGRKLGQHANKIYELSRKIAQTGEKAIQLGQSAKGDHDKLIAAGKAANQCADNIGKLAAELKNLAGKSSRFRSCAERFANRTGQMTNYAGKLLNATQLILDGCDASLATDDFLASSSEQNVHAWAHSICKVFDDAGDAIDIIPDGALPDFMLKYWKALFAAPSTFISAFESIMKAHYDKINGIAEIDNNSTKQAKEGSQTVWTGDLIGVYVDGCFLPKLAPIPVMEVELTFQQFMDIHKSELGPLTFDAGKARLLELIDDSVPPDDPAKLVWFKFVSRHAA